MKKRFVVCHSAGTTAQDQAFKDWLNSKSLGWWHWISGSWLVVDHFGILSAMDFRDALGQTHPGIRSLVVELPPGDVSHKWAGFGPNTPQNSMANWLNETWSTD